LEGRQELPKKNSGSGVGQKNVIIKLLPEKKKKTELGKKKEQKKKKSIDQVN
jgi:hypothetical protein